MTRRGALVDSSKHCEVNNGNFSQTTDTRRWVDSDSMLQPGIVTTSREIYDRLAARRNFVAMTGQSLTVSLARTIPIEGPRSRSAFNGERTSAQPAVNPLKRVCRS